MPGQLPEEVKLSRLSVLQRHQDEITAARLQAWCGRTAEILVDGASRGDAACLQGRLSQNIVVNLTRPYPDLKAGVLAHVRISEAGKQDLKAMTWWLPRIRLRQSAASASVEVKM